MPGSVEEINLLSRDLCTAFCVKTECVLNLSTEIVNFFFSFSVLQNARNENHSAPSPKVHPPSGC